MGAARATLSTTPTRFHLLDPIRGFAAIWVFVFHYHFTDAFRSTLPTIHSVFKMGDLAVPLFFVISGYCIALAAEKTRERLQPSWHFVRSRLRRIYPTFWYSLGVIFVLRCIAIALHKDGLIARIRGLPYPFLPAYGPVDWLGVVTLTRGILSDEGAWWGRFGQVNGAFWTLAIEMQFYLTVGLLLVFRRMYLLGLTALSLLSCVVWFYKPWFLTAAAAGTFLPYWSWFSCGLLLWYVHRAGWTPQRLLGAWDKPVCLGTMAAIGILFFLITGADIKAERFVFSVLSATFLWCLQPFDVWFANLHHRSKPWHLRWVPSLATALGTASYTIYLLHNEVSMFLTAVLHKHIPIGGVALDALVLTGTIAVCYALFLKIEKPFITKPAAPVILSIEAASKPRIAALESESAAA